MELKGKWLLDLGECACESHTHTHTHTQTRTCSHTHTRRNKHTRTNTHTHTHIHSHTHKHTHTHTHTDLDTHTHARTHTESPLNCYNSNVAFSIYIHSIVYTFYSYRPLNSSKPADPAVYMYEDPQLQVNIAYMWQESQQQRVREERWIIIIGLQCITFTYIHI